MCRANSDSERGNIQQENGTNGLCNNRRKNKNNEIKLHCIIIFTFKMKANMQKSGTQQLSLTSWIVNFSLVSVGFGVAVECNCTKHELVCLLVQSLAFCVILVFIFVVKWSKRKTVRDVLVGCTSGECFVLIFFGGLNMYMHDVRTCCSTIDNGSKSIENASISLYVHVQVHDGSSQTRKKTPLFCPSENGKKVCIIKLNWYLYWWSVNWTSANA